MLTDQGYNIEESDLIRHNMVVFRYVHVHVHVHVYINATSTSTYVAGVVCVHAVRRTASGVARV